MKLEYYEIKELIEDLKDAPATPARAYEAILDSIDKNIKTKNDRSKLTSDIRVVIQERLKEIKLNPDKYHLYPAFYDLLKETYRLRAYDYFDDYLIFVEWDRSPEKKFYLPRRQILKPVTDALQDLEDNKFEILSVSLPPRVGKSTMGVFFISWVSGRKPHKANVMSGHSDKLTDGFFREVMAIITDDSTYNWAKVFPHIPVARINSKDEIIDLESNKRFPTLTCRSIEGTLTGAVEAGNYLYCDDLVSDLEEALSPDRLAKKYDAYVNQLKDRKKMGAKEIHIGTRWSVADPIGRIREQFKDSPKYREIVIPALDENDESNFNYPYDVGFDSDYFKEMRETVDAATWSAKYIGEPYEREGLLFPEDELKYFNGVLPPKENLVRVYSACDVSWGGGDNLSMPFIYEYEDGSRYVKDVVFQTGTRDVTQPIVVGKLKYHRPSETLFEANNGGAEYAYTIDDLLKADGLELNIRHDNKPNTKAKLSRIIEESPAIKDCIYLDKKHRSPEYEKFMQSLTSFVQTGKNKHDDAADSMAEAMKMRTTSKGSVQFFKKGL
jgi:predicted phage terminase large subunit-like protein